MRGVSMGVVGKLRWSFLLVCGLAASSARAADTTYLRLPNVSGPANATPYSGWFEVGQHALNLVPGTWHDDTKSVTTNCTATVRARLDAAGVAVTQLVGARVGDVRLDTVSAPSAMPYRQAVLRNAVLTQQVIGFDAGVAYDTLSFRFDALEVTSNHVRPDGARGSGAQAYFDCLRAQ